ncbi:MAG: hypothetical protein ACLSAP_01895 [Oscillospiraceae bacterium]
MLILALKRNRLWECGASAIRPYASRAYFDAYDANQVTLKGKTLQIGAINGPYFMVFLDGNVDQNAVKAFLAIGFGS